MKARGPSGYNTNIGRLDHCNTRLDVSWVREMSQTDQITDIDEVGTGPRAFTLDSVLNSVSVPITSQPHGSTHTTPSCPTMYCITDLGKN